MNPKKQRAKDRRRASKLAEQAWDAVDSGNLDLAEKIIRRATDANPTNPVHSNDQGMVLALRQKDADAADAFRTAMTLAPTFAEPFAQLAALRIRQGFTKEAVALQEQAVGLSPGNSTYSLQLEAYRALAGQATRIDVETGTRAANSIAMPEATEDAGDANVLPDVANRLLDCDWSAIADQLTRMGCARIAALLDAATCGILRAMFDDELLFAKSVVMDRPDFGQGEYRYFRMPVPAVVQRLRRTVYPHVAEIANRWQSMLNDADRYPEEWSEFAGRCHSAGQTTPTPILLKYGPGGFNALHRDLRGAVYFPIQMAVVLSPRHDATEPVSDGFAGGDFVLCDVPEGKRSARRTVPAGLGDAVLFCTRDRLIPIGGAYGLQPVKHGADRVTAGVRFVLGLPFHDYR